MALMLRRTKLHLVVALAAGLTVSASAAAQTRIDPDKNRFSPAQDVELGRRAAAELRRELPIVRDRQAENYVGRIGERLVAAIPARLRQPQFRYTFQIVDRKDINAFALPGGPIFVNRGMLEAARNDGEVAGVIAHELSHVVLRHATAQATKGQKFQLGALAGQVLGSVIGGRTGAVISQGSQIGIGTYFMKYSREYEREADLLGVQMMARAGYDPREMANMFQTIARRGGNGGPEWLSDHPSPANRYAAINREAALLRARDSSPRLRSLTVRQRGSASARDMIRPRPKPTCGGWSASDVRRIVIVSGLGLWLGLLQAAQSSPYFGHLLILAGHLLRAPAATAVSGLISTIARHGPCCRNVDARKLTYVPQRRTASDVAACGVLAGATGLQLALPKRIVTKRHALSRALALAGLSIAGFWPPSSSPRRRPSVRRRRSPRSRGDPRDDPDCFVTLEGSKRNGFAALQAGFMGAFL